MTIALSKKQTLYFAINDEAHDQLVLDSTIDTTEFVGFNGKNTLTGNTEMILSTSPAATSSTTTTINSTATHATAVNSTIGTIAPDSIESVVENDNKEWINRRWRPVMAWVYMATCCFDFILAPILWSILQAAESGLVTSQWIPLTLQGAGLYHLAMGAVLGITAYGRTKEKLASGA